MLTGYCGRISKLSSVRTIPADYFTQRLVDLRRNKSLGAAVRQPNLAEQVRREHREAAVPGDVQFQNSAEDCRLKPGFRSTKSQEDDTDSRVLPVSEDEVAKILVVCEKKPAICLRKRQPGVVGQRSP